MEKKEFLNEEKFQKTNNKISKLSLIILIIGLLIGGSLIFYGVKGQSKDKLNELKEELEYHRTELESEGITLCGDYTCGKGYDIYIIDKVLDPTHNYCSFNEYKNNDISIEYCKEKNKNSETVKTTFIMIGVFVSIVSLTISGYIFFISKARNISAYMMQQSMPLAQESLEKMAPTLGKTAATIAKEIKETIKEEEK